MPAPPALDEHDTEGAAPFDAELPEALAAAIAATETEEPAAAAAAADGAAAAGPLAAAFAHLPPAMAASMLQWEEQVAQARAAGDAQEVARIEKALASYRAAAPAALAEVQALLAALPPERAPVAVHVGTFFYPAKTVAGTARTAAAARWAATASPHDLCRAAASMQRSAAPLEWVVPGLTVRHNMAGVTASVVVEEAGAHSGRATCAKCGKLVTGSSMRIKCQAYHGRRGCARGGGNGWGMAFHHFGCWEVQRSVVAVEQVWGYDALSPASRERLRAKIHAATEAHAAAAAARAAAVAAAAAAGAPAPAFPRRKRKGPGGGRQKMGIPKKKKPSCARVLAKLNRSPAELAAMPAAELEAYVEALGVTDMQAALKANGARRPPSLKADVVAAFAAAIKGPAWSWDN